MAESDDPVLEIELDGERTSVDLAGITGIEWRAIKRMLGLKPREVFDDAQQMDFEALAALLWVVQRRDYGGVGNGKVDAKTANAEFEEILSGLSLRSIVGEEDEDEADDGGDPPSSSGENSES